MENALTPYPLPPQALEPLLTLAQECDVLLIGELHGTQEVPRLVFGLLDSLAARGYGGLGLEIPEGERDRLESWARDERDTPPNFFTHPSPDGRANAEVLKLVRSAVQVKQWRILCFDQGFSRSSFQWTARDEQMAHNCLTQRRTLCPQGKVLVICGSLHARLRANTYPNLFPSFARRLQMFDPDLRVGAVQVGFWSGAFFNMGVRRLGPDVLPPQLMKVQLEPSDEFSLSLRLAIATPATFLAPPHVVAHVRRKITWAMLGFLANVMTKRRARRRVVSP